MGTYGDESPVQGGGYGDAPVDGEGRPRQGVTDIFTGNARTTPEMDLVPELGSLEVFAGEDKAKVMAILPLLALTTDPDEIGAIVTKQFPNITLMYNKDAQGDLYPLLANGNTGAVNQINKPGLTAWDATQGATITGAFTPAGRVGLGAGSLVKGAGMASLAAGGTESATQSAQSLAGGEFNPKDVALAAATGPAGPLIERAGSALTRQAQGIIPDEAQKIIETGAREQVPVMTSDVVPPRGFVGKNVASTGEKVPIVGTGGKRVAQQEAREDLARRATESASPEDALLVEEFSKEVANRRSRVGSIFNSVEEGMVAAGDVDTSRTIAAIDRELAKLNNPRVKANPTDIATLEDYKTALEAGQTFADLDALRTDFRVNVRGDRMALPSSSEAMSDNVYKAMSEDLKSAVGTEMGPEDAAKWWGAKEWWGKELKLLKDKNLIKLLNKGESTPELIRSTLTSAKPSDLKALHKRLTPDGRAAARATIIDNIVEKGTTNNGLTPDAFATQLRKHKKVIEVFFSERDVQQLKGLKELLNATRRGQAAGVETPTGQSMWGILGISALADAGSNAGAMLASMGGMARIYESKPVRDALLRLSTVPPGTGNYDAAVTEAAAAITAAAQRLNASSEAQAPRNQKANGQR